MLTADKPGSMPTLVLHAHGNVEGGIRTPWVDVPTARLSGLGNPGTARSFGITDVFDQATLDKLYPAGRAEYLKKFDQSLESTLKSGFILSTDGAEIRALAAAMYPGSR
jgi:Alpha/beta hydrolase domain